MDASVGERRESPLSNIDYGRSLRHLQVLLILVIVELCFENKRGSTSDHHIP